MFTIPNIETPELQAFFVGFVLPFITGSLVFAVAAVRDMLSKIDSE